MGIGVRMMSPYQFMTAPCSYMLGKTRIIGQVIDLVGSRSIPASRPTYSVSVHHVVNGDLAVMEVGSPRTRVRVRLLQGGGQGADSCQVR